MKPVDVVHTKKLGRTGVSEVVMVCEEVVSPLVADEAEHENWLRLVDAFGPFPTSSSQRVLADVVAGKVLWEGVLDGCMNHLTAEEELHGGGKAVGSVEEERVVLAPDLAG